MLETKDRSKVKKKAQKFFCPFCQNRLWRLGSPRYSISDKTKLDRHKTSFSIATNFDIKQDLWWEEFFCEEHGKLWVQLYQETDETVVAVYRSTYKQEGRSELSLPQKKQSPAPKKAKARKHKKKVGLL